MLHNFEKKIIDLRLALFRKKENNIEKKFLGK
jgi:hypothetical protein